MTNDIGPLLERVAHVSKGWIEDPAIAAPLRHMSQHLNQLSKGLVRSRHRHPAAVRDVESLFCMICQRIKVEPDPECERLLAHCPVLKTAVMPAPWTRF